MLSSLMPIRRDPRAERARLLVPGSLRPRLDRGGRSDVLASPPVAAAVCVRSVPTPEYLVLAIPDAPLGRLSAHDRQLLGAAHILAGATGAVVVIAPGEVEPLGPAGADRVLLLDAPDYDPPGRAATIAGLLDTLGPRHVLFPESADGADLARRVAAIGGRELFSGVEALSPTVAIRACGAGRFETRAAPGGLMTIAADRVAAYSGPACEAQSLPSVPHVAGAIPETRLEPGDPAALSLAEAGFVLAAGNGVHDLAAFRRLAHALGATPGASRVLCDAGLMPRDRQVGASGTVLTADCYFALGISGAPQHLAGIAGVVHVIAVNTDLHAAMVARATLAVIADAQAVMQALLHRLEAPS